MGRGRLLAGLLHGLVSTSIWAGAPATIASTNLCTDQLLVLLAEPGRIASLSQLAADPDYSFVADQARAYPDNAGGAEELLQLQPRLVLISSHTPRTTRARLREQGLRLEELQEASSLKDIRRNLRTMGRWLGTPARAEAIIQILDQRVTQVTADTPDDRPSALFLQPNGYTSGRDTLQDEALRLAGWRNLAAQAGIKGYAPIDLEQLITLAPDAVFTSSRAGERNALALRILDHPALRSLVRGNDLRHIDYRYWICGGPMLADAIELLADHRRRLAADQRL